MCAGRGVAHCAMRESLCWPQGVRWTAEDNTHATVVDRQTMLAFGGRCTDCFVLFIFAKALLGVCNSKCDRMLAFLSF